MLTIKKIEEPGYELKLASTLFTEYANELNVDLCFQHFNKELENPLAKYGAPTGCLFIAFWNGEPAGCIALQATKSFETCEMKRLYIRPSFRKFGIGDKLVKLLIREARRLGYRKMLLDTLDILEPAIRLYQTNGFTTTLPYYSNPLPGVIYMELDLKL